jgi:hypothetical protein
MWKKFILIVFATSATSLIFPTNPAFAGYPEDCDTDGDTCCQQPTFVCASGLIKEITDNPDGIDYCICKTDPAVDPTSCDQANEACCKANEYDLGYCLNPALVCDEGFCQPDEKDYTGCDQSGQDCCFNNIRNESYCKPPLICTTTSYLSSKCLTQEESDAIRFAACDEIGDSCCANNTCAPHLRCDEGKCFSNELPSFDLCRTTSNGDCNTCMLGGGMWTALGCISFEPKSLIKDFLAIAITIAGGIALLLMIYGSFLISTSAGDPKKAEEGKEIITGAIAGLLFIIFSVFLLRLIGVEILNIPGL